MTLPQRRDVPREETWDIEALFTTVEDWEKEAQSLREDAPHIAQHAGKLHTPQGLLAYLQAAEALERRL